MDLPDEVDVLVVGSGAGGLATALIAARHGLEVLLIEKTDRFGGATALSGGGIWVPCNSLAREAGLDDDLAEAADYSRSCVGPHLREDLLDTFLQIAPEAIDYLQRDTPVKLELLRYMPDYEPERAGSRDDGRLLGPVEFDGRELGPLLAQLRMPLAEFNAPFGMMVALTDLPDLQAAGRRVDSTLRVGGMALRYMVQRLRHGRGTRLTMGNALAARLLRGASDAGVSLRRKVALDKLEAADGRVVGARVRTAEGAKTVRARRGVVLATGGFSSNPEMRARYIPFAEHHVSLMPPGNTGDGIRAAAEAGAALDPKPNRSNAVWNVISLHHRKGRETVKYPHLFLDKPKPGCIAVNDRGERFGNEASLLFTEAMHATASVPAWLICDAAFLQKYGLGLVMPGGFRKKRLLRDGYLIEAPTLSALAEAIGAPAAALASTVERFNEHARGGEDPDFGRGGNAFDLSVGDPEHSPNATLGPIERAPFYAVKIYPGDASTTVGLMIDPLARVLREDGTPIDGLYANGLDMNSLWRGAPPANGCNNTLSLTFGYIAARHMAGVGN